MKIIILSFLIILCQKTICQNISTSFTTSPEIGNSNLLKVGNHIVCLEWKTENNLQYTTKLTKYKFSIKLKKLDKDFNLLIENSLAKNEAVFGPFKPSFKLIEGKLFLFYFQFTGADNDLIKLFVSEINLEKMELGATTELINFEEPQLSKFSPYKLFNENHFILTQSPDSSKYLFLWHSSNYKIFFYAVTDMNFKRIKAGKEEIQDVREIQIKNAVVCNNGKTYIPYIAFAKSTAKAMMFVSDVDGSNKYEDLNENNFVFEEVFVSIQPNNNIAIVGQYWDKEKNISGVFYQSMNISTNEKGTKIKTQYPIEKMIEQLKKHGWAKIRKNGFDLWGIKFNIITLNDGTICLHSHLQRTESSQTSFFSLYGSILNVYIKNGEVTFSLIPKQRVSTVQSAGSFVYPFEHNNKLVVFYNDSPENLANSIDEPPIRSDIYTNHVLIAATFERDGTVKREKIINETENNLFCITEEIENYTDNKFIISLRKVSGLGVVKNIVKWAIIEIN